MYNYSSIFSLTYLPTYVRITTISPLVLRQVALKHEISTLRTQVNQVSLERDKLKSSLNRTIEEKQKLITEGDDHVEMVTKKSEREKRLVMCFCLSGRANMNQIHGSIHKNNEYQQSCPHPTLYVLEMTVASTLV